MSTEPANVVLIGYRGTGKTTVAQLLARDLGWSWIDTDSHLEEQQGQSIRTMFAERGESHFRDLEAATLHHLGSLRHYVVATGGGTVLRPENRKCLRRMGFVVWLTGKPEALWERLQEDAATAARRPQLTVGGLAEIQDLLALREPLYRECADLEVDTTGRSPEDVAKLIRAHIGTS